MDPTRDALPIERDLGVQWCVESDTFKFLIELADQPFTKRGILSTVSPVFDPLGGLALFVLIGNRDAGTMGAAGAAGAVAFCLHNFTGAQRGCRTRVQWNRFDRNKILM